MLKAIIFALINLLLNTQKHIVNIVPLVTIRRLLKVRILGTQMKSAIVIFLLFSCLSSDALLFDSFLLLLLLFLFYSQKTGKKGREGNNN